MRFESSETLDTSSWFNGRDPELLTHPWSLRANEGRIGVHPVTSGRSSGLAIVNVSYFYQNLAPLCEFYKGPANGRYKISIYKFSNSAIVVTMLIWPQLTVIQVDVVPEAPSCDLVDFCNCPTRDTSGEFRTSTNSYSFLHRSPIFFHLIAIVSTNLLAYSHKLGSATSIPAGTSMRRHLGGESHWRT